MANDEVGQPIWTMKREGKTVLSAASIAEQAGVSEASVIETIQGLTRQGVLEPILTPLCLRCGTVMGEFDTPEEIPEELACPYCNQNHHFTELDVRFNYRVVSSGS